MKALLIATTIQSQTACKATDTAIGILIQLNISSLSHIIVNETIKTFNVVCVYGLCTAALLLYIYICLWHYKGGSVNLAFLLNKAIYTLGHPCNQTIALHQSLLGNPTER